MITLLFALTTGAMASESHDIITPALKVQRDNYAAVSDDRFANLKPIPLKEGDNFTVKFPFLDGERRGVDSGGSSIWTYKEGVIQFHFSAGSTSFNLNGSRVGVPVIYYRAGSISTGSYRGQNAFGVSAHVKEYLGYEDGVAVASSPKGELSPYVDPSTVEFFWKRAKSDAEMARWYDTYIVSLPTPPNEARRLATDVYAEMEGTIAPVRGRITACDSRYSGPTINHPWEKTTYSCWAGARIERVAFIDRRDGRVLKEWLADAPVPDVAVAGKVAGKKSVPN